VGTLAWVEDDAQIRKLVQAALRALPHELHFATNGREGLELVERVRPDVLFTDVSMPEMDGLQMVDALRRNPEFATLRIVFVTASVQREQIERYTARVAGSRPHNAPSFIAKPFSPAELRAHIERLVPA
jgi:CheY-like chemotaxis protein